MPELEDDDAVEGYRLPGIYGYILGKQKALADAPDPRVFLVEEGPERDALIEQDRLWSATRPGYRSGKASSVDIDRLESGLPVLILRRSIDTRPIHTNEEPGRMSWPEAKLWPEISERSVDWFELHPDDRLVPVPGDVDRATYWG
jgi:hypothetical protein